MNPIDVGKKTIAFITGASKGIGREIAVQLSKELCRDSVIILVARSEDDLLKTKSLMSAHDGKINVLHYPMDLSKPSSEEYDNVLQEALSVAGTDVENAIIFHNAGSLGTIDRLGTLKNFDTWQSFCNLNISHVGMLNAAFMQAMNGKKIYVINITSLIGSVPFKTAGMYGLGKSARNYYFKVLAMEEPEYVVLNYSPGPVNTAMFHKCSEMIKDETVIASFDKLKSTNTVLTTEQTVCKLFRLLKKGDFASGDIVDYYDYE